MSALSGTDTEFCLRHWGRPTFAALRWAGTVERHREFFLLDAFGFVAGRLGLRLVLYCAIRYWHISLFLRHLNHA
jgi:hypothetical protein